MNTFHSYEIFYLISKILKIYFNYLQTGENLKFGDVFNLSKKEKCQIFSVNLFAKIRPIYKVVQI